MSYKNDNLDELFQKASGDYPLKTNSSNWDNVAARLNNPDKKPFALFNNKFTKYALFILSLSLVSVAVYKSQFNSATDAKQVSKNNIQKNNKAKADLNKDTKQPNTTSQSTSSVIAEVNKNSKTVDINLKHFYSAKTGNKYNQLKHSSVLDNYGNINSETQAYKNTSQNNSLNNSSEKTAEMQNNRKTQVPAENKIAAERQNVTNNTTANKSFKAAKSIIKYREPASKLYGSLYASPEFSVIKSQHTENPGYKIGISLGYRINSRFDIEIGLQREHIKFYTNGKYFDKSALKVNDAVPLEDVKGSSKLTSVPVTLKYNFPSRHNGNFYAVAGINAVLLTHTENYDYIVSKNGNLDDRSKNYNSVNGPEYFTSIVAAAGYETKLSNWCNLKVEPYYQIPTSNIGIGKLPVTSFGINLGVVKNLK